MNRFTVEETNLISIYHTGTRSGAIKEMTAALPSWNVRGMRASAKPHSKTGTQQPHGCRVPVLFLPFTVPCKVSRDGAVFCIKKVLFSTKKPPVRASPIGGNVFPLPAW